MKNNDISDRMLQTKCSKLNRHDNLFWSTYFRMNIEFPNPVYSIQNILPRHAKVWRRCWKKTFENQTRNLPHELYSIYVKAINSQCMFDTNSYFCVATKSFRFSSKYYYMSKIRFLSFTCSFLSFPITDTTI